MTGLPPYSMYNKETWEATITRDYLDHLAESGAHLLDESLKYKEQVGLLLYGYPCLPKAEEAKL